MNDPRFNKVLKFAVSLLIAAVGAGVGIVITSTDDGNGHKTRTIHIVASPKLAPPAGDLQAAPPDASHATEAPQDSNLRDQTPPDVPPSQIQAGKKRTSQLGGAAKVSDKPLPVGGAQSYTIRQDFSGHVYSDFFSNITPTEFCLHYTVSPNILGWGDIYGVRDFFRRTMAASATFIADFEGHILQMVPLDHKAWTQGAFNPFCRASIEMIATGSETRQQWLNSVLFKSHVLADLMTDVMRKYNLPRRFVDPKGCVAIPGYTDHNHIECGNSHTDVAPNFPFDVLARQLADGPSAPKPISAHTRAVCHKYAWYGPPGPASAAKHGSQARIRHGERHRYLRRHNIKCSAKGVATRR